MRRLLITFGALTLLVACGPKDVGSECQGGASENDCVEGALCTLARSETPSPPDNPNNERFYCRTICEIDANCEAGFECRQAAGTMTRTCQPDDDPTMTDPDAGM